MKIALAGSNALLLDVAGAGFSDELQQKIWTLSERLMREPQITEVVPGMNNLLVMVDPLHPLAPVTRDLLATLWAEGSSTPKTGDTFEITVDYGGDAGEDLQALAEHAGLSVEEVVRRHTAASYRVSAIGAMPGFPYLSGLDPSLAMPRRSVPRARVREGAVIIGGPQTGMMPTTAPSGWHIIGQADVTLFDAARDKPSMLSPGDTIRFRDAGRRA